MSEYTSTREGFQRAMEWSLIGPPEEAKSYAEGTATPTFYHVMNDHKSAYDEWVKGVTDWRSKVSEYKPVVREFLRDGQQLAARITGTIKVEGQDTKFESFIFGQVDKASGKLEWLIERSVWGPVDGPHEHGIS